MIWRIPKLKGWIMFRKTSHLILSTLFSITILSACGPSQAEVPATTTQEVPVTIATHSVQPNTATATVTLSPTKTATMTLTASPIPTNTPMDTLTPTAFPIFWDDFSAELQPGWTWIRENDALWSLTSEPGFLRIVLQGGRPPRNLLVRDVTSENFQIMTRVLFEPTSNFQFAGLLVYQDENSFTAFGRAYCDTQNKCVGNGIYFDAIQSGQYIEPNFGTDTQVKEEAYLRIDKVGSIFTGYYSEDGSNWSIIGEHEIFMVDPKVGLLTGNSYVVGMTAKFDYYSVMEMP
jgi:beta-xylosidase